MTHGSEVNANRSSGSESPTYRSAPKANLGRPAHSLELKAIDDVSGLLVLLSEHLSTARRSEDTLKTVALAVGMHTLAQVRNPRVITIAQHIVAYSSALLPFWVMLFARLQASQDSWVPARNCATTLCAGCVAAGGVQ